MKSEELGRLEANMMGNVERERSGGNGIGPLNTLKDAKEKLF